MKRFSVLLAALGLVLFVSSCKNTMDLTKRRYTKGYHFEKHTAPSTPPEAVAAENRKEKAMVMEPITQSLPVQKPDNKEISAELKQTPEMKAFGAETKKSVAPISQKEEKIAELRTDGHKAFPKSGSEIRQKNTSAQNSSGGGDSDVKLILCIILAIFIPPLAMYIWDRQTDVWFIVDLVLFLLLFTWFFFPFGLIGLTAIVIAILRILDAI
jgi:uncharacterized membrane protein YqaE (UPF0057 family)